jgi:hypothetical protein
VCWNLCLAINFIDWVLWYPGKPQTMWHDRLARRAQNLLARM